MGHLSIAVYDRGFWPGIYDHEISHCRGHSHRGIYGEILSKYLIKEQRHGSKRSHIPSHRHSQTPCGF